jgi:glycosyltransferase involved in cell wall biosynthesis
MTDRKATVYSADPSKEHLACTYYRAEVPLRGFKSAGVADTWLDAFEDGLEATTQALAFADFDLFWSMVGESTLLTFDSICSKKPIVLDGVLTVPPTIIYDIDDNVDFTHPHNAMSYVSTGVRAYPSAALLKPGDDVIAAAEDGEEPHTLWVDGETKFQGKTFSIARNLEAMRLRHRIMRTVHGMTVPSPHLANYLQDVVGVKNVHVFPNTVIPEDYKQYELVRRDDRIRILWQGGSSHTIDWYPLRFALRDIAQKYPNVCFVMFGSRYSWVDDFIPAAQLEIVPWVKYNAYRLQRGLLSIDINLCPLAKNAFNKCKSAIKWYEGSVWHKPEATLASRVSPYSDEMVDNETGLLYRDATEFAQKLSLLIEDADLRARLGQAAKRWVLANRTPEQTIPPLWKFYEETRNRRIGEFLLSQGSSWSEVKRLAREQQLTG